MEVEIPHLKDIIPRLIDIASTDDVLSKEEEAFLEKIKAAINQYEKELEKFLSDNVLTRDEFNELLLLRDKVLTIGFEQGRNEYSADEMKLLSILYDLVDEKFKPLTEKFAEEERE